MLYEVAYPALYLGAKTHQTLRRTRAMLGIGPRDMQRVIYSPDSFYRVTCWRLRKLDVEMMMRLAPMRAARLSVERFERTRRMAPRMAVEAGVQTPVEVLRWRGKRVVVRRFGPVDGPRILALHGWNGRASMLRRLAEALAAEGFQVLVPDLPGHGDSEGSRYSFYDLGQAVADLFGDVPLAAVIGHSAGGLIAAIALDRGLPARTFIPVGSPMSLASLLRAYVDITQMPVRSLPFIERYYARRYGTHPGAVGPELIASLTARTLVVHEQSDWQVGPENAHAIVAAARDGQLLMTTGCTHLSVVNAGHVHRAMVNFIRGGADA